MAAASPTELTMRHCRGLGWVVQKVEHWNSFAKVRQDLFGCIDVVALGDGQILGIQCTTRHHMAERMAKARAEARITRWLQCGGLFEVWGWQMVGRRWQLTRQPFSVPDLAYDSPPAP